MHLATATVHLHLPGVASLKEKRRIVKSLLSRMRRQFNVAAAEIDANDVWQTAVIAIAVVGNDRAYLHAQLEHAVTWITQTRPDLPLEQYRITFH